jgi:hypothetical protein
MCLPALAKRIAVLFETLMAILHYLSHRSLLRYVSWYLTNSGGWRDVAMIDASSV